jgi:hypothetical protein
MLYFVDIKWPKRVERGAMLKFLNTRMEFSATSKHLQQVILLSINHSWAERRHSSLTCVNTELLFLGIEFEDLCLLGKHSTTRATPLVFLIFNYFSTRVSCFCLGQSLASFRVVRITGVYHYTWPRGSPFLGLSTNSLCFFFPPFY